jgi:RNA polymerase sigma factor (sigma-70 family)
VGEDIVALDEALDRLAASDPEAAELVKLRFFAGLTSHQAAEVLGISVRTAERAWTYARAFLLKELKSAG